MRPNRITIPAPLAATLTAIRARAAQRALDEGRQAKPWYRVEAKADEAVVYIYDEISWFGITAADFVREIQALDVARIVAHINSPGGFVDDGIAIYNGLRDHPAAVSVVVDGGAQSIASVIAMAADPGELTMNRFSNLMIHDAASILDILGYFQPADLLQVEQDVRQMRLVLEKFSDLISGVYAERAGGTPAQWREAMKAETWYTAEEAVAAGLADRVAAGGNQAKAFAESRLFDTFRNTPEHLQRSARREDGGRLTKREAEQALRDAGMPVAAARALVAQGWSGIEGAARDERADDLAGFILNLID
jgi:ATP-dependent protease ClpP protease subunit